MPAVVFANRKGGVGKTLSTLYTGRWLARAGRDVTLVDLDPQKSLWDIAALLGRPDGVFAKRGNAARPRRASDADRCRPARWRTMPGGTSSPLVEESRLGYSASL